MIEVIVAMTKNGGIGLNVGLAWNCKEELKLFKEKTAGNVVVMGRKTVEWLPFLKDREIWCLTNNPNLDISVFKNKVRVFTDISTLLKTQTDKTVFIAGGAQIYKQVCEYAGQNGLILKYHVSVMKDDYKCDTFWKPTLNSDSWAITEKKEYVEFIHIVYEQGRKLDERKYVDILKHVFYDGNTRIGRNGETKSTFCNTLSFDLRNGFPLITTKKMFWRGIVEELLFFLNGYTDSKMLEEKGVNIWQGNTDRKFLDSLGMTEREEGVMGPMYGWQWRNFGGEYDETETYEQRKIDPERSAMNIARQKYALRRITKHGFDQLAYVIDLIKNDPYSRRIMMTDYNPSQAKEGVLYPCHSLILQFYVDGEYLDMSCYNRSQDLFHGVPFNIASSSLLLLIIAKTTGKTARNFFLCMGDTHIYSQHYSAVEEQIKRIPCVPPTVVINKELRIVWDIENLKFEDFVLQHYMYHPAIKAEMVA